MLRPSQRVMLALTHKDVSREEAYAAVQGNAMKVWRGEGAFLDFLKADARVTLPAPQLEAITKPDILKQVRRGTAARRAGRRPRLDPR